MLKYLTPNPTDQPFILFSFTHLSTLFLLLLVITLIYFFRAKLRNPTVNLTARVILAVVLIVSEISLHAWLYWINAWDVRHSLPFHLSSISLVLSVVLLITKSYRLFEFTYFAGVGSALQAMITPDISAFTFPHFRYVHFFISHGGIVIANMFILIIESYRPTFKSIWKAFLILKVYTAFVLVLNYLLNGNYMYISRKPVNPSLLDYLAPWPWYILQLELIALCTFFVLYVPFFLNDVMNRKKLH